MPDYYCLGRFRESDAGHTEHYFSERFTFLDFRGELKIASTAAFGFCNRIFTQSHSIASGQFAGPAIDKRVVIEDYAWITSYCTLYDCTIGHHAIVSVGAVVDHMVVPPWTIVKGNPARAIAQWDGQKWVKIDWMKEDVLRALQEALRDLHE